ncbi:MAG: hypothetical protein ACFFDH_09345 [Promethearchaeota archaeon]
MIEEPFVFLGILIISLVMSSFLLSDRAGMVKPIAWRLFYIGVIFHELSHAGMSLVVGRVPNEFKVKWRHEKKGYRDPHGSVKLEKPPSFLQAIVIALGPLYISTWLIFGLVFGIIFNPVFNPVVKTISIFLVLSLLLTAAPSGGDIRYISQAFNTAPAYSCYQILLISLSMVGLWVFLMITHITFFLDVFYYLAIAGIYLTLKFSFIGIRKLVLWVQSANFKKPKKVRFSRFSRKHYKPKKPWKER